MDRLGRKQTLRADRWVIMNMHRDTREFWQAPSATKPGLLGRMLNLLAAIISGAKGEHGVWTAGARGL